MLSGKAQVLVNYISLYLYMAKSSTWVKLCDSALLFVCAKCLELWILLLFWLARVDPKEFCNWFNSDHEDRIIWFLFKRYMGKTCRERVNNGGGGPTSGLGTTSGNQVQYCMVFPSLNNSSSRETVPLIDLPVIVFYLPKLIHNWLNIWCA